MASLKKTVPFAGTKQQEEQLKDSLDYASVTGQYGLFCFNTTKTEEQML